MTVAELIEILKGFPEDLEGYETGIYPIHRVKAAKIVSHLDFEDWDGEYLLVGEIPGQTEMPRQAVTILGRRDHRRRNPCKDF